jgi:hypothetical protein
MRSRSSCATDRPSEPLRSLRPLHGSCAAEAFEQLPPGPHGHSDLRHPKTARKHHRPFGTDSLVRLLARATRTSRSSEPPRSLRPCCGLARPKSSRSTCRAHERRSTSCGTHADLGALGTAAFAAPCTCAWVLPTECAPRTARRKAAVMKRTKQNSSFSHRRPVPPATAHVQSTTRRRLVHHEGAEPDHDCTTERQ